MAPVPGFDEVAGVLLAEGAALTELLGDDVALAWGDPVGLALALLPPDPAETSEVPGVCMSDIPVTTAVAVSAAAEPPPSAFQARRRFRSRRPRRSASATIALTGGSRSWTALSNRSDRESSVIMSVP